MVEDSVQARGHDGVSTENETIYTHIPEERLHHIHLQKTGCPQPEHHHQRADHHHGGPQDVAVHGPGGEVGDLLPAHPGRWQD